MLPVLENLIEQAGNFETALELIQNAHNMIDSKLGNLKVSAAFKQKLDDYKYRCSQKLQSECINLIDQWINSKI